MGKDGGEMQRSGGAYWGFGVLNANFGGLRSRAEGCEKEDC